MVDSYQVSGDSMIDGTHGRSWQAFFISNNMCKSMQFLQQYKVFYQYITVLPMCGYAILGPSSKSYLLRST